MMTKINIFGKNSRNVNFCDIFIGLLDVSSIVLVKIKPLSHISGFVLSTVSEWLLSKLLIFY